MLCGIGGATVAEAKLRMSQRELMSWIAFRRKRGTLHAGMRLDEAVSRLCVQINRALGGKSDRHDFLPHHEQPVATADDVMAMMGAR